MFVMAKSRVSLKDVTFPVGSPLIFLYSDSRKPELLSPSQFLVEKKTNKPANTACNRDLLDKSTPPISLEVQRNFHR